MTERWHVARVAADRCAVANLLHQGYRLFDPRYAEEKLYRGRRIILEQQVFRGYVFVIFDVLQDRWRAINSTPGVVHLLPIREEMPIPLPEGLVEELMTKQTANEILEVTTRFNFNQAVQIILGPFAGSEGRVEHGDEKSTKLKISAFQGRETLITVPTAHLMAT